MTEPTLTPEQERRVEEIVWYERDNVKFWQDEIESAIGRLDASKELLRAARARAIETVLNEQEGKG